MKNRIRRAGLLSGLLGLVILLGCGTDPASEEKVIKNIPEINFSLYSNIDSAVITKKAVELDKKLSGCSA